MYKLRGGGTLVARYVMVTLFVALGFVASGARAHAAAANGCGEFRVDLHLGMRSGDVKRLQMFLNSRAIYVAIRGTGSGGLESPYFGRATKAAVQRFQKSHSLPSTGSVGPLTRALIGSMCATMSAPSPAAAASSTAVSNVTPTPNTPAIPPQAMSTLVWNRERATHLARRVLLAPTQNDIDKLAAAGDAQTAVSIAFQAPDSATVNTYQKHLSDLLKRRSEFNSEDEFRRVVYMYQLVNDPDRARRKLFYLWENIYSVDGPNDDKKIKLEDVVRLHDVLYQNTFGNYADFVEKVRMNYALEQYLDLTDSDASDPNENFARELLMLFVMGEHSPANPTMKNYTEADVNALAHVLTGYTATPARTIVFDQNKHSADVVTVMGEQFNDPTRVVPFLFQKRNRHIAEFLGNKLLRFYITDHPTQKEISIAADTLQHYNFDILPSIQALLASDVMYDPKNMYETRVKSPLELIAQYYTYTLGTDSSLVRQEPYDLDMLGFAPYNPGSVFGRAGFVDNRNFLTGTVLNKWLVLSYESGTRDAVLKRLIADVQNNQSSILSPDALIDRYQQKMLLTQQLQPAARARIREFLSTDENGQPQDFNLNDIDYLSAKLPGIIAMIASQPEFVLQSADDSSKVRIANLEQMPPVPRTTPKLIVIKVDGGLDYQGLVANIRDPKYAEFRGRFALNASNSTILSNGYALSNLASPLLPLLNRKQAFLLNAVGLPDQSRGHDIASEQMETGFSTPGGRVGILGQLYPPGQDKITLVSMTDREPFLYRGGSSLQIGDLDLRLVDAANPDNKALVRQLDLLKQGLYESTAPQFVASSFSNAFLLNKLSQDVHAADDQALNFDNKNQLSFISRLIDYGIGNIYYLYSDKGFDAHENNQAFLENQGKELINTVTSFFNRMKNDTNLTIVLFSEFGRTNHINGSDGTDHGAGGGVIVLSNQLAWPALVGTMEPSKDENDWTTVQVDVRDVWGTLLRDLYGTPLGTLFPRNKTIFDYPRP